jgi:hypothetical protein
MVEEASGIAAIPQQMGQPMPQQMAPQMPPQMAQAPQPQAPMQMAEGGLAALSLPDDMFDEESYAGGGIVAFDEGGEVPGYAGPQGSFVQLRPEQYEMLTPLQKQQYVNQFGAPPAQARRELNPLEKALGIDRRPSPMMEVLTKGTPLVPEQATVPIASRVEVPKGNIPNREMAPGIAALKDAPVDKRVTSDIDTPRPTRNRFNELVFNPVTVDDAGYGELMPDQRGMRDYAAEFKSELGEDPGRAAVKERLARMQATGEKDAERAPWMALAEAGLGMAAGQSQFALQNIATGGIRGIQSFNEARDRLVKAEERRFDLENKVAQAERAEQLAAINYGADSKRADDQNRRAVGLAKQADKARAAEVNARGQFEAAEKKIGFQLEESKIGLQAEANRIARASNLAEKQRAMYEKALDNARAEVTSQSKATGTEGSMSAKEYNEAVYSKYLDNLKALGLPPLGGPTGYTVLGVEESKPNKN